MASDDAGRGREQLARSSSHRLHVRWPASLAVLAIGGIYLIVSDERAWGPPWLPMVVVVGLLIPLNLARWQDRPALTRGIGLALVTILTAVVASSAAFLMVRLPGGGTAAADLLRDAALIWAANVLIFALWYWEIDSGGPAQRHQHGHRAVDFVFPQAVMADATPQGWQPGFIDYLFLAFNTATAFSPTDTMVLSRRAKGLMMAQSIISLTVVAVLAARAINTL